MATRTFLQLVNDVLLELREPTATTWSESDYSTLIGRFVNSAKRDVENAWDWTALRASFSVTTVAADPTYTLTGAYSRFKLLKPTDAYNFTQEWPLRELNRSAHRAMFLGDFSSVTGLATGSTTAFSFAETLDSGSRQVNVWPVPEGAETLRFFGYNPPEDFTADNDVCYIPSRPIVEVALARARGERGEDGGIAPSEQAAFALRCSQDEIARDAGLYDEDLTWEAV